MKAKKFLIAALALAIVLCPVAAYASGSPGGGTVTIGDDSESPATPAATTATPPTPPVVVITDPVLIDKLQAAASDYVAQQYGSEYVATPLLVVDIQYSGSGTINVNVSGVTVGGLYYAAHQKEDGTIEILNAVCNTPGVITLSASSYSPVTIFKVETQASANAALTYDYYVLPQTGDQVSMLPMALLMIISLAVLTLSTKALVRNSTNR